MRFLGQDGLTTGLSGSKAFRASRLQILPCIETLTTTRRKTHRTGWTTIGWRGSRGQWERYLERSLRSEPSLRCSAYTGQYMAFSNEMFSLTVPILEKIVRPVIVYAFLVLLLRVFGKRE